MTRRGVTWLTVALLAGACGRDDGTVPSNDRPAVALPAALTSEDPDVAGPAFFAEMTRAVTDKDVAAMFALMTREDREWELAGAQRELDRMRDEPEALARVERILKLDRSPTEMSREEWAEVLMRRVLADPRARENFERGFGSKYVSARREGERLILVAEGSAEGADGERVPYLREHVLVRDEGGWRVDERASRDYASRVRSLLLQGGRPEATGGDVTPAGVGEEPGEAVEAGASGHRGVEALAFSRDGRHLLAADGRGFTIWDWKQGREVREILAPAITHLFVHPEGNWLVTGGGRVTLWDLRSGEKLRMLQDSEVSAMDLSPDGGHVATAHWETGVRLVDVATGESRRVLEWPGEIELLAFLGSDRLVFVNKSGAHVLDFTGKERVVVPSRAVPYEALAASPDGKQLALASEDQVDLLDAASGRRVGTFEVKRCSAVCFSPGGRVLVTVGGEIRRWRRESRELIRIHSPADPERRRESPGPTLVAYHPDGKLLAVAAWNEITLFDTDD